MKQLGLLFGNTSHAAAVTLAVFFGGLAAGGWLWGRRSAKMSRPLRAYGWLELCIAGSAIVYFVILRLYYAIYPGLYATFDSAVALGAVKFALAMLLVFPPALFMGGTIPVMGEYLIGKRTAGKRMAFGSTGALLYGVNTFGAATGAFMAGFFLPRWVGFNTTAAIAITVTAATAVIAFLLSRGEQPATNEPFAPPTAGTSHEAVPWRERFPLAAVCFLSGFGFLALEVLWTRMFMQVLENSVYTFATILVVVLIGLAVGALISAALARMKVQPVYILAILLLLGGMSIALTPHLFMAATDEMAVTTSLGSWAQYIALVFTKAGLSVGLPAVVLGAVFPFLMKTEERYVRTAGRSLGRLAAINTVGAILGALVCGFVLLGTLGMWRSMLGLAAVYLIAAMLLPIGWKQPGVALRGVAAIALLFAFTWLNPANLTIVGHDPARRVVDEVIEAWEASDGTVTVTRGPYGLSIRMNSHYGLGTTNAAPQERFQFDLPMHVFPQTSSVFFLGMGTGITAGAALADTFEDQVERVVVCELSPQVVEAARKYMTDYKGEDYTQGLFDDPRATVLAEDGRHYLMATRDRFDMINADLFVPYRRGVGSLYTREHFENARQRLTPDGVFVQWLPLYQLTEFEFFVIIRTMLDVFDQVTLWRGGMQPGDDVVGLVGRTDREPLPPTDVDSRDEMNRAVAGLDLRSVNSLYLPFNEQTALMFYGGNLTEAASLFADYPINTDDRPVIEYAAPRTFRNDPNDQRPWFIGPRIAALIEQLHEKCPPQDDPMLANRSATDRLLPIAGRNLYGARVWMFHAHIQQMQTGVPDFGALQNSEIAWNQFVEAWLGRTTD